MIHDKGAFTIKTWVNPKIVVMIVSAAFLSACGGSGDSGGDGSTNSPPTVTDQSFSAEPGKTLTVNAPGVLESSSDPDNDTLTAVLVSDASHGTLTLNANGSFEYVHNGSSSATDSFTFKANDGTVDSNTASVTINVTGIPVTTSACLSTEDLPTDLNDFVTDDDVLLGFSIETSPTKGTVILQPDGTLSSYTPNPGATGFDSFTYQVDDGNGGIATGTVNIAVSKTRIMPLGDSITAGVGPKGAGCSVNPTEFIPEIEQIGYRAKLFTDLDQDNYFVDFVGSFSFGLSATPPIEDPDHEGIGGNKASDVLLRIPTALSTNPTDIVLLHIGTNNIRSDNPLTTISNIEQILDAIDTWAATNNEVTVLLSTIINRSTKDICDSDPVYVDGDEVDTLNEMIKDLDSSRPNIKLVLVDQHGAMDDPDTQMSIDGVHPNQTGYRRMADEWFDKLTDASNNIDILRCPTN
ncbi:MAG: Ig-like domain-containing protein [Pseudomonadota bacterium]